MASLSAMPALSDVLDLLHGWFPPATADDWDAVGLVRGDPAQPAGKVMFAVDPAPGVAEEAAAWGADLLVVHHPLFLAPVHGIPATTPKGRTLHTLAEAGCALLTAHTNADQAVGGVSDALAAALGLSGLTPILPAPGPALDQLTCYVPAEAAEVVRVALAAAGAGRLGDYEACTFSTPGEGRFRPVEGADPAIGQVGVSEVVDEVRVEAVVPRARRHAVLRALFEAHPYEEVAHHLVEITDHGMSPAGTGRVGGVEQQSLRDLAAAVDAALPTTAHGVRVAGDPGAVVRRVAVCGGAGDFLLDAVRRLGVDAYVTSDLRHHPTAEFREWEGPALLDVAHWAAEWTWLPVVEQRLAAALAERGDTVETHVSTLCTDPWQFRA